MSSIVAFIIQKQKFDSPSGGQLHDAQEGRGLYATARRRERTVVNAQV